MIALTFLPFSALRSRNVARSGTMPMYQNSTDVVRYVVTANTSHISGLRNCGHIEPMSFGSGIIHHANHGRPVWSSGNNPAAMTAKFVMSHAQHTVLELPHTPMPRVTTM